MSQQTTLFSDLGEMKPVKYITHYYSKKDVMKIWNITDHKQFVAMIGTEGVQLLNWKEGKQKFTPRQVRELIELVGKPITREEISR